MIARLNIAPRSQSPSLGAMTLRRGASGERLSPERNPLYYPQRSKSMDSGEFHVTIPTSAPASVRVEKKCSTSWLAVVSHDVGLNISALSNAIPSATTEHEQVPTSITKKHKRQLCYRRQAANVGGREMVLGRICNGRSKPMAENRNIAYIEALAQLDDNNRLNAVAAFTSGARQNQPARVKKTRLDADALPVNGLLSHGNSELTLLVCFPRRVNCFHVGFHGDTTVETDANVASVGFRPVPGVITPVRSVNSADFMSHKHEAAMVSREPKAILVKLALSPQP